MAKAIATILDGGRELILKGASGAGAFVPHSFQVGNASGFVPVRNELTARGTTTYTGSADLMQNRVQSTGSVRYTVVIPEGAGPFDVGNVLFFAQDASGTRIPFAMVALPFAVPKRVSDYDITDTSYPVPGNRFMVSITVKHDLLDSEDASAVVVDVISPEYANLAFFENEVTLPAPDSNPYAQFVLQRHTLTAGPAFVTKGADNRYWAAGFLVDVRHPKYNVVDGGVSGSEYTDEPYPFLWGHRFETPDSAYRGVIGGAPFDLPETTRAFVIGGAPF